MSFHFLNSKNEIISQKEIVDLFSELNNGNEVTITVFSDNINGTNSPGIYVKESSFLGEVNIKPKESKYKDMNDLLHWGSNEDNDWGLEILINGEFVKFKYGQGSSFREMISLPQAANMTGTGNFDITLRYKNNPEKGTRKLFIGIEVEDVS
jgi:hypothetical protein